MDNWIKLTGMFGLVGSILIIGYLFYDKNSSVSYILIGIGIFLAGWIIENEIECKKKRHEAPWYDYGND